MFPFAVLISLAMGCTTPQPASDWICVNGGWIPPNMVQAQQAPAPVPSEPEINPPLNEIVNAWPPYDLPVGPNATIIDAAQRGEALPNGDVYFTPPLVLKNVAQLRGSGRTVLRPITTTGGPLIIIQSSLPGWWEDGYPLHTLISEISLICRASDQIGVQVIGANMTFERFTVSRCGEGIRFSWAVNITVTDSKFMFNKTGLLFAGSALPFGGITTVRVLHSEIAGSSNSGVVVWRGLHTIFQNNILENNATGIQVVPLNRRVEVLMRDTYFEANTNHYYDPSHIIRFEGNTGVY